MDKLRFGDKVTESQISELANSVTEPTQESQLLQIFQQTEKNPFSEQENKGPYDLGKRSLLEKVIDWITGDRIPEPTTTQATSTVSKVELKGKREQFGDTAWQTAVEKENALSHLSTEYEFVTHWKVDGKWY